MTVYLDRACPGLLAAACLIYSMLKKERNVTENEKKVIVRFGLKISIKKAASMAGALAPCHRPFYLPASLVCGPAYITTLSLTNRGGRFMRYAKQRKDKIKKRIAPGESIQVDSGL